MDKTIIKVKISGDRVAELYSLYDGLLFNYEPANDLELLLFGHVRELHDRLYGMVEKEQEKYTLSFDATDALAFALYWKPGTYKVSSFRALIIQAILDQLDQTIKTPQKYIH